MPLASLIRSEPFRVAVMGLGVFLTFFAFASWALIGSVATTLREDLEARIQNEAELLGRIYRREGREGLIDAIRDMNEDGPSPERSYGLFDERNLSLTGPMAERPNIVGFETREMSQLSRGLVAGRYVLLSDRVDQLTLVVGGNGDRIEAAKWRLTYALGAFGLFLTLSTLSLGLWAAQRAQRRLDQMDAVLYDVSKGQLDARLPVGSKNDQFDRVARRMNSNLAQLERLVASVKTTASAIAHDLKTPLSHVQIAMHEVADAVDPQDLAMVKVQAALEETDRLNHLFETILRLSRIQTTKDRSQFAGVSLQDIAATAVEFCMPVAEEQRQVLALMACQGTDRVEGDRDLIQQAIVNLVQNACVHAGPEADIKVSIEADRDSVTLSVCDTGAGIETALLAKITEPFARGTADRNTPGHGLGLAMVAAIADLHDAELILSNTAEGFAAALKFKFF